MIPGEIIIRNKEVILNAGKKAEPIKILNTGDRAVQVGSHFHFFEVNKCLFFDRKKAFGKRLDIPSGTAIRFESGETIEAFLINIGGNKKIYGLNDLTHGAIEDENIKADAQRASAALGFKGGTENEL